MHFNSTKSIVFICLLAMLNACGIGRYHSLNLVRPDKKNIISIVKSKHKTNKVEIEYKADSAIAQTTVEDGLTEIENSVPEKKGTLIIPYVTKSSPIAKKVKLGLKEKVVFNLLNKKNKNIYEKSNKKQNKPKPCDGGLCLLLPFIVCLTLLIIGILVGLIVAAENLSLGLLLILGITIVIFLLFTIWVNFVG